MASDAIMSAIERFDRAAQDWGFESDAGTGGVKSAGAEYTAAKAALLALVTAPEVKDVVLKPCPLDNHPVVMQETLEHYPVEGGRPAGAYTVGYSIFCANCGLHIHDESEEDLLKLWNGRAGVEFVDGMEKPARALEQAHTLLLAIEQTPANVWHVAVDDPEIMCSEVIEAVESALETIKPVPTKPRVCPSSPNGQHQVDTSMESGPNNCFHCEAPMPRPGGN
jgi:hypothetical protein